MGLHPAVCGTEKFATAGGWLGEVGLAHGAAAHFSLPLSVPILGLRQKWCQSFTMNRTAALKLFSPVVSLKSLMIRKVSSSRLIFLVGWLFVDSDFMSAFKVKVMLAIESRIAYNGICCQ